MMDLEPSDPRAYAVGRTEEPFPSIHVSLSCPEEESNESRLDAITLLALLVVNSGLIMAVVNGGAARFEGYSGAAETVLTVLWSLQAVITFLFFVVVARWLRS
jgi:hypothetical protein